MEYKSIKMNGVDVIVTSWPEVNDIIHISFFADKDNSNKLSTTIRSNVEDVKYLCEQLIEIMGEDKND